MIDGLGVWGQRWARSQMSPGDLDPGLLMWDIHRRLNVERLPARRVVVLFDFRGVPKHWQHVRSFWLVIQRAEVDLCLKSPGHEVDLVVDADLATLTKVWMGDLRLGDAMRSGLVRLEGPTALVRAFPGWLALSGFASVEQPRAEVG